MFFAHIWGAGLQFLPLSFSGLFNKMIGGEMPGGKSMLFVGTGSKEEIQCSRKLERALNIHDCLGSRERI